MEEGELRKEPWSLRVFVRHYNEIAAERGGPRFDPGRASSRGLRERYEASPLPRTLREFALARFMLDHQM